MNGELAQLRQQIHSQHHSDTNKQVDKLEKDLHAKKTEIAGLRDKVTFYIHGKRAENRYDSYYISIFSQIFCVKLWCGPAYTHCVCVIIDVRCKCKSHFIHCTPAIVIVEL